MSSWKRWGANLWRREKRDVSGNDPKTMGWIKGEESQEELAWKLWETMWTCHIFCLRPFLKKLGLKSIEQKKVLNEGVMACSINMESIFLVALARRASTKISEDLAECAKVDNFFFTFFPLNSLTGKVGPSFRWAFSEQQILVGRIFFFQISVFFLGFCVSPKNSGEISRIHLEYPQGLVRHSCKLCGFHLCESSLWQQGKPTIFFVFLEGLDSPMLHNSYWGRQYKKQYTNDKFTGSRKTIFWMVCPKRLLFW